MKTLTALTLTALAATAANAEDTRHVDAHEHGVGALNIAFDGTTIAMEFHAPGADIVGFEYAPESAEDRAAVDTAVATLARPLDLFVMPADAKCSVTQASAELEAGEEHHDEHHEDHAEDKHEDHAEHGDHKDEDHAEHKDHDHDAHEEHAEEEAGHTEFHAEYTLTCATPAAATEITFAYFDTFPNALEVEVQVISATGANAFEVERDAPILDLRGMF